MHNKIGLNLTLYFILAFGMYPENLNSNITFNLDIGLPHFQVIPILRMRIRIRIEYRYRYAKLIKKLECAPFNMPSICSC